MPLKLQILSVKAVKWIGWCKGRLAGISLIRKPGQIMRKIYALPERVKARIVSSDICDIITIWGGSLSGVIFQPRSGPLALMPYVNDGIESSTYGVAGGWENGSILLATKYPYPLDDEDNASFLVSGKDDAVTGGFAMDASRYGNLYWMRGDDEAASVISWRGTPTRHFPLKPSVNMPGFSVIEELVEREFDMIPEYSAFGTVLYQNGNEFLNAPRYSWPTNGPDRCFILGAMQNVEGTTYIMTLSNRRNSPPGIAGPGFYLMLWAQAEKTDKNPVDGWKLIAERNYGRNGLPWFGNASGTQFVCSNGDKMESDGNLIYKMSEAGVYKESIIDSHWRVEAKYTGSDYYEYVGDSLRNAVRESTLSATEDARAATKNPAVYASNSPLLFTADQANALCVPIFNQADVDVTLHYPDKNQVPGQQPGAVYCIEGQPMVLLDYQCTCNFHSEGYLQNLVTNNLPAIEVSLTTEENGRMYLQYWTWDNQGDEVCEGCPNVMQLWEFGPTPDLGYGTPSPVTCGTQTLYEITQCSGGVIPTGDISATIDKGGTAARSFVFANSSMLKFNGVDIPACRTNRTFSYSLENQPGQPTGPLRGISNDGGEIIKTFCDPFTEPQYSLSISENCVVEKSTLHYLDQRYGVLLYRYVRETLKINKSSNEYAKFNGTWGAEFFWKMKLNYSDAIADCVEEWHLLIDGRDIVLDSVKYAKQTLSGPEALGDYCSSDWSPDPDVGLQLLIPQPDLYTSQPVADQYHPEYYCDVLGYGFYKSAEIYSRVDYFYPDWCKNLQNDETWILAEQSRAGVVYDQGPLKTSASYQPPCVNVEPLPIGSYVKHPAVGEVYQWLTRNISGQNKVTTSRDFNDLIDNALGNTDRTHDITLYYPISLA